jgi:signal transduction histidine kinase
MAWISHQYIVLITSYITVYSTITGNDAFTANLFSFLVDKHFHLLHLLLIAGFLVAYMIFRERRIKRKKEQLRRMIETRSRELEFQQEELKTQIEFTTIQNHKIENQNRELEKHRQNLEELVRQRTSDLEQAKLHAEESDRLKSAFLSNMSHEIRTPMNAIVGFTNIMMEEHLTEDEQQELLEHIHDSSNYLLKLIENIIDISKMESGELTFKYRLFDVEEIINDVYHDFKNHKEIHRKNLHLKVEKGGDGEPVFLSTDSYRLKQILNNLVDNAIKFTYKGSITLGYSKTQLEGHDAVRFSVNDTGIGISQQQQKHIFELFRRNTGQQDNLYRGTGIGLSICRRITEGLNGKIAVESTPGKGSVFSVAIPQHEIDANWPAVDKEGPEKQTNQKKKRSVLFFGQDPHYQEHLRRRLSEENIRLYCTQDRNEALDLFSGMKNQIDLIIVDSGKQLGQNLETARELRNLNEQIPIIGINQDTTHSNNTTFNQLLQPEHDSSHLMHLIQEYIY